MLPYSRCFRTSTDGVALGDHICSMSADWIRHGIYIGSCQVIGLSSDRITQESLDTFTSNGTVFVRPDKADYTAAEIVQRAKSQLGATLKQNIPDSGEYFCKWCRRGLLSIT